MASQRSEPWERQVTLPSERGLVSSMMEPPSEEVRRAVSKMEPPSAEARMASVILPPIEPSYFQG